VTGPAVTDTLAELDAERRASGVAAGRGGVVREYDDRATECRIVYSHLSPDLADDVIREEMSLAEGRGYTLEWKVYGHDRPVDLPQRLVAVGFEPDDPEQVLVMTLTDANLAAFSTPADCELYRVPDEAGLADYAEIAREIGRKNPEQERERLAYILREAPETMSVYVAYVGGEPVAGGRIHYQAGSGSAELAGGRTKTAYRRRGLFKAIVGARLQEAHTRGRKLVFTDALPSSEPILVKHGFWPLTSTRPFVYDPAS
jgi:hypothetical protein